MLMIVIIFSHVRHVVIFHPSSVIFYTNLHELLCLHSTLDMTFAQPHEFIPILILLVGFLDI